MGNTPAPCSNCEHLYFDAMQKDNQDDMAECKFNHVLGNKGCPDYLLYLPSPIMTPTQALISQYRKDFPAAPATFKTLGQLLDRLQSIAETHGRDLEVRLLVEGSEFGQIERPLVDVALPRKYIKGAEAPEPATHVVLLYEESSPALRYCHFCRKPTETELEECVICHLSKPH